jgi:class 3 adenylate cyclase
LEKANVTAVEVPRLAPRKSADESFVILSQYPRGDAMAETRKIAAILVADVVGYSRLAGARGRRSNLGATARAAQRSD